MSIMKTKRGWWDITYQEIWDPSQATRERIAELIKQGFTSGEMIEAIEEEDE